MVLENKIYQGLNNPLEDYVDHIDKCKEKKIHVVLSPKGIGDLKDSWISVSYQQLVPSIQSALSEYFISEPLNKWVILLREFLQHLEELMSDPQRMDNVAIKFFLENLNSIYEMQSKKQTVLNSLRNTLEKSLADRLNGRVISSYTQFLDAAQTFKFGFKIKGWLSDSDVVLAVEAGKIRIYCYPNLQGIQYKDAEDVFNAKFTDKVNRVDEPKGELKRKWLRYQFLYESWTPESLINNSDEICDELENMLRAMDDFEQKVFSDRKKYSDSINF